MVSEQCIFLSNLSGLYTSPRSVWGHVPSMFYLWLDNYSISCISVLELSRTEILRVGCRGGFYSLFVLYATSTVGICPVEYFIMRFYFVDLFGDFHYFEHVSSLFISFTFKTSPLGVCPFFHPPGWREAEYC